MARRLRLFRRPLPGVGLASDSSSSNEELSADREAAEAFSFRDTGFLKKWEGSAACAYEDEGSLDGAVDLLVEIPDGEVPAAVFGALDVSHLVVGSELDCSAGTRGMRPVPG